MKKYGIILIMFLLIIGFSTIKSIAQKKSIGVAIKGSTMGVGGDLIFRFHERMTARLGFDMVGLTRSFTFEEQDVTYNATANIKSGSITALYDFYLAKSIFVSAGLGLNNFKIKATGAAGTGLPFGDIIIPAEKVGNFEFDLKPSMRFSPYLGIGFGKTLGKDKNFGFAFELGTFYQGSPDLTITTSGLISPTSNPDQGQEALLEGQISQYYLYPVLKLSLSYKIFNF
jgi:opacity protein-like surface antigen